MNASFRITSVFFLGVSLLACFNAVSLEAQTILHVPLYTFHGDSEGDLFGFWVSGAGDVNGDGRDDLIVGARGDDNNGLTSGSARVLSGSDGSVLYDFDGTAEGDVFGFSVSGAGDVNGDGKADLLVGTRFEEGNVLNTGRVRVLSGSDGSLLYNLDGDGTDDLFGWAVSGAGDVNGDGRDDIIVGAFNDDDNGVNSGSTRVLSGIDGSVLFDFDGDVEGDLFGWAVSGAGDVNGDGADDFFVGAREGGANNGGYARVLSGSDGSVLYTFDGDSQDDLFGRAVSGAGDVNGDGLADLIVGAFGDDNTGSASGSARVLSGSDGSVLYNFDGDSQGDQFGRSVTDAGDVNGDGKADFIVGAPLDDGNGDNSGCARVFSGSNGSVLYNLCGDNANDWFGWSVSNAGDVNGDGIEDFVVGASRGGANGGGYARVFVSQILGDINQDGVVNFLDISPFVSALSASYLARADMNADGTVNFLDIGLFIELLTS